MSNIINDLDESFSTNWGNFTIGQKVVLSDEAKQNDSYEDYFNQELIICEADLEDEGLGTIEPIISFDCVDGSEFPFSLYGYEIELA